MVGGCAWCCSTLAPPELLTTPRRRFFSMRQQPVGGTCWATSPSAMLGAPTRFASHPSRVYGHPFWIWLSRQGVTGGASSPFPDVVPPPKPASAISVPAAPIRCRPPLPRRGRRGAPPAPLRVTNRTPAGAVPPNDLPLALRITEIGPISVERLHPADHGHVGPDPHRGAVVVVLRKGRPFLLLHFTPLPVLHHLLQCEHSHCGSAQIYPMVLDALLTQLWWGCV